MRPPRTAVAAAPLSGSGSGGATPPGQLRVTAARARSAAPVEPGEPRPTGCAAATPPRPRRRSAPRADTTRASTAIAPRARPQLLHQPGLADPRFPADDHQLRRPAAAARQIAVSRPIRRPPPRRAAALAAGAAGIARQRGLIEGAGLRRRLDPQLALERRGADVIGVQRAGRSPAAWQTRMSKRWLSSRSGSAATSRSASRIAVRPTRLLPRARVPAARAPRGRAVRAARARRSATRRSCPRAAHRRTTRTASSSLPSPSARSNCSTSSHSGASGRQPSVRGPDLDQAIRVGQRVAQTVQDLAQVRPRLRLGRVGPQ